MGFGQALRRAAGSARLRAAGRVLLVAAWCALAAGLLEGAHHAVWHFVLHRLVWASRDVYWLAPLSYLAFFALPAVLLAGIAGLRPRWVPLWLAVWLFATPAAFGVLELFGRHKISHWALALLALGIAVQAARAAKHRPAAVLGTMRATGLALAAVLLLLLAWFPAGRPLRERLQLAGLPAAVPGAPNVLLIILDTVRGDELSLYGYQRPTTPNLERFAKQGAAFENAFAAAPWTLPSHATLFTGRWPHELSAHLQQPLYGERRTLAEVFRERGYLTGGFVANLIYTARDAGLARGFGHYVAYQRSLRQLLLSSYLGQTVETWRRHWETYYPAFDRKLASDVSGEFLSWLDGHRAGRPFFAFLNYYDAHQPYYAPRAFRKRFAGTRGDRDEYDAAIAYLDDELGKLFASLQQRGVLDRTIVVVAADHGEQFGEHGLTEHGNSLYDPVLRVPLIIRYPGVVPAGSRIDTFVSLRDVPATLVALAGGRAVLPGQSLASLWSGQSPGAAPARTVLAEVSGGIGSRPEEPISRGPMKAVFVEPFHYIRNGDGTDELYDLRRDRKELHDLSPAGASRPVITRIRRWLNGIMARPTGRARTSALTYRDVRRAALQRSGPSPRR